MSEQNIVFSIAWFQPEEWHKLKETVADPSTLDDCYEDWRKSATSTINELRANGQKVEKISIKIDRLLEWCKENNREPDSKARSEFAALLSQKRHK